MNPTIKKIQKSLHSTDANLNFNTHRELEALDSNFIQAYQRSISLILFDLFPYMGYNIRSHKDALILITKLYHSLLYLNIQTSTLSILDQLNRIAYDTLKNVKPTPFTKLNKINVDSADDIIRLIENYKTNFLKEPHEKSD